MSADKHFLNNKKKVNEIRKKRLLAKQAYEKQLQAKRIADNIRNSNRLDFITLLLDNQCANEVLDNYWHLYHFETHCRGTVEVVAKKINGRWVVRSSSFKTETE